MALQESALLSLMLIILAHCQQPDIRKPPVISSPPSTADIYYTENSNALINCTADAIPPATYKWLKNGQVITKTDYVSFDDTTGVLKFSNYSYREDGIYMCIASNSFNGGQTTVASWSPRLNIGQQRVEDFGRPAVSRSLTEFEYSIFNCYKNAVVGTANYQWYNGQGQSINMDNDRLFIDSNADLHFTYVKKTDDAITYACGISFGRSGQGGSQPGGFIKTGTVYSLSVTSTTPVAVKPQFRYSNSGVQGQRLSSVKLECMFSGYDPLAPNFQSIIWRDDSGKQIINTSKYTLLNAGRVLTISSLQEEDERMYTCVAKNSAGEASQAVFLNVTSVPIFTAAAPIDQTKPEGSDVPFNCETRSASGENPPSPPVWYINGNLMTTPSDPKKFHLSNGNKVLTIMNVTKATDIMCIQCEVTNSVGTVLANACLNVILPITIVKQPSSLVQEINYGDSVDLTVTASTDPSLDLKYRWEINNKSYEGSEQPPNMYYNPSTMLAYINTSKLTDDQYLSIAGPYRRVIYHFYEVKVVEIDVVLADRQGDAISTPGTSPLVTTPHPSSSSVRTESTEVVPPTPSFFRHDFECHQTFMRVYIQNSLVPNAELTMKDPGCRLQDNGTHYVISFLYDMCGTSLTSYTDHVNVQNQITVHTILSNVSGVEFVPDYIIPLQCSVNRTRSIHSAFQVVTRDPMDEHDRMASDFDIKEYRSELYQDEITEYPVLIPFNREIFFDLVLSNNQTNSGISVTKCEATPSSNPNDATRLTLITNGCSASPAVKVQGRYRIDHFRFSVQAFHFSGSINQNNTVYVHCNVSICQPGTCTTVCSRNIRRRRSSRHDVTLTSGTHIVASEVN